MIADTTEERMRAIRAGAAFFTWTSFSHPPAPGTLEPVRFGDMPLDFDCKRAPQVAMAELRRLCCNYLPERYGVDSWDMRFFLSGGKGFHAEIPSHLFGLESGHPKLPVIYRRLVQSWADELKLTTVDLSLYCMGKGKMWRIPNIRRPDGRYKVPLSRDDVAYCSFDELWSLGDAPKG